MRKTGLVTLAVIASALAIGCEDPTGALDERPNLMGKGGGGKPPGDGSNGFTPVTVTFDDTAGNSVVSDGRGAYADDVCGVNAEIENDKEDGTMTMDPDNKRIKNNQGGQCVGTAPRDYTIHFVTLVGGTGSPDTVQTPGIMQVKDLNLVPAGGSNAVRARFNTPKCSVLAFTGEGNSSLATATLDADSTEWTISVSPADVGFCRDEGSSWSMNWSATIAR